MNKNLEYVKSLTVEQALKAISPRGNGKSIKTAKPKDGVMVYVWRMARFHSGQDTTMPMTCFWDLERGLKEATGEELKFTFFHEDQKAVLNVLDALVDQALVRMGYSTMEAAKRYKGLLY